MDNDSSESITCPCPGTLSGHFKRRALATDGQGGVEHPTLKEVGLQMNI